MKHPLTKNSGIANVPEPDTATETSAAATEPDVALVCVKHANVSTGAFVCQVVGRHRSSDGFIQSQYDNVVAGGRRTSRE